MSAAQDRNLEQDQKALTQWVREKMPGADKVEISDLRKPGGSGFSNDTLLCSLSYHQAGQSYKEKLVIRISPSGFPLFPFYDIPRQFDIMHALGENTATLVPRCRWKETDPSILGEVFYAMDHVDGQIPTDNPPYPLEGFVKEASPAQREKMWWSGIKTMAELHRLDWRHAGLDCLAWPENGQSPIEQHLQFYEAFIQWAAGDRPVPRVIQATLDWLKANMPTDEPEGIIWGDARLGNMIFQDFEVVSVLDWEMAAMGNPEADLAWWLFVDKVTMRGNGMPDWVSERLEGMPSDEQTIERYEQWAGRKVKYLKFYEVFAGLRFSPIMMRLMQQLVHIGMFDAEMGEMMQRNNVVTQLLAEILDLPAPE